MKELNKIHRHRVIISFILLLPIATIHSLYLSLDSQNYREAFEFYNETRWNLFFNQLKEIEAFYLLIAKLYPTDQLIYIFTIVSGLSIFLKLTLISKTSKIYAASIIFYLTYYFPIHEGTQIRVSLAVAIAYWGVFSWTQNKKIIGGILVFLSGIFFHYSLLTLLPALFILSKKCTRYLIASWVILITLYFLDITFLPTLKYAIEFLSTHNISYNKILIYVSTTDPNSKPYSIQILILLTSTIFVYYKRKEELNNFQHACFNLLLFSFCILVALTGESILQNRISQIYRFSIVFIIPLYYTTLKEHFSKKWYAETIFSLLLILYYLIYNSKLTDFNTLLEYLH